MKQNPAQGAKVGLKAWRHLPSGWYLSCRKEPACLRKEKKLQNKVTISKRLHKIP